MFRYHHEITLYTLEMSVKDSAKYGIKIGNRVVKIITNHKKAKAMFRKERARHGGKVKFFELRE